MRPEYFCLEHALLFAVGFENTTVVTVGEKDTWRILAPLNAILRGKKAQCDPGAYSSCLLELHVRGSQFGAGSSAKNGRA